jgi:PIN domain nuclease of toxin-antitoxin system
LVEGPYLLDTSTMIWSLASPERLSPAARKAVRAGPLVLSVVAYWEIAIKSRKGLIAPADPVNWWARATEMLGGSILSIRASHVSSLSVLEEIHKDPFDRMLIAQAIAEGLALVTSDEQIRRYPVKALW